MQTEAARGINGNVAVQIERVGAVVLHATLGVDVAAEELAVQPVELRGVFGEANLAIELRQRRHVFYAQAVVLEAQCALDGDMRLRRARHGQLERE